ncbi:hypothetical protein V491_08812, partial [Pseudogymnoascus sp. VKM F-3775]
MSTDNPDNPMELGLQKTSESPENSITTVPGTEAPCVGSGANKDIQDHVADTSTANKHAVPWPRVEPWRKNVVLACIFVGVFFSTLDTTIIGTAL